MERRHGYTETLPLFHHSSCPLPALREEDKSRTRRDRSRSPTKGKDRDRDREHHEEHREKHRKVWLCENLYFNSQLCLTSPLPHRYTYSERRGITTIVTDTMIDTRTGQVVEIHTSCNMYHEWMGDPTFSHTYSYCMHQPCLSIDLTIGSVMPKPLYTVHLQCTLDMDNAQ